MTYNYLATAVLLFMLASAVQAQNATFNPSKFDNWTTYTSAEGGFSVQFPGAPVIRQEPAAKDQPGRIKHIVELDLGRDRHFEVSWIDQPGLPLTGDEAEEESLRPVISDLVAKGGTVAFRTDVPRSTCTGKEVSLQLNQAATKATSRVQARSFVSGDRVFLILYSTNVLFTAEPELAGHFLDSFAVTGRCAPKWIDFDSPEGGFSVQFTDRPKVGRRPIDPQRPDKFRSVVGLDTDQGRHFEVNYFTYDGGLDSVETARITYLNQLIEYFKIGGQLIAREDVTRGGCHGEQATLNALHPVVHSVVRIKLRVFSSFDTIYLVMYGGNSPDPSEDELADAFLDSFHLTGDCRTGTSTAPIALAPEPKVSGELDPATGWQRIESTHGVGFLMPALPRLAIEKLPGGAVPHFRYTYDEDEPDHHYTIDVIEDPLAPRATSFKALTERMISFEKPFASELAESGIKLGAGTSVTVGALPGRDYALTAARSGLAGRMRTVVTPTRLVRIVALAGTSATAQAQLTRFIDSVKIDAK